MTWQILAIAAVFLPLGLWLVLAMTMPDGEPEAKYGGYD